MFGSSSLERLEEVKKIIRSLLVSQANRDITLRYLNRMYKDMTEESVPFSDFNYTSLRDFLLSMPDVLRLINRNNETYVEQIDTEKSVHITNLVKKAKNNTFNSYKTRLINPIDPSLIYKTLQSSMILATLKKSQKSISKVDFLAEINSQVGDYTFYSIDDLSSQLHEFTHLLRHDDDYIYFKNKASKLKVNVLVDSQ